MWINSCSYEIKKTNYMEAYMFEERNKRIWEKVRPKGMKSYLIRQGIKYALLYFILFSFLAPLVDHGFSEIYFTSEGFRNRVIVMGIFTPVAGIFMAYGNWKSLEKKYR